jgi:single-strand DNA-binding protein
MQKNRIELAGYLAAKPELRHLPSGTQVANARLAEGYRFVDRNKQEQRHTNWHNLVFYGDISEITATFDKGDNLFIEGSLQTRQFTPKDGSQRTVYEVIVRSVHQIAKPKTANTPPDDNNPTLEPASPAAAVDSEEDDDDGTWPV